MNAAELLAECHAGGITLQAHDGQLDVHGPEGQLTDELLRRLRNHKAELLVLLADNSGDGDGTLQAPEAGRVVSPAMADDLEPQDAGRLAAAGALDDDGRGQCPATTASR
jgi:pyochelin synthetase